MPINIKKPTIDPEYDVPANQLVANLLSTITGKDPRRRAELTQQVSGVPPFDMTDPYLTGLLVGMSRRYTPRMVALRERGRLGYSTGAELTKDADKREKLSGMPLKMAPYAKKWYRDVGNTPPNPKPSFIDKVNLRKYLTGLGPYPSEEAVLDKWHDDLAKGRLATKEVSSTPQSPGGQAAQAQRDIVDRMIKRGEYPSKKKGKWSPPPALPVRKERVPIIDILRSLPNAEAVLWQDVPSDLVPRLMREMDRTFSPAVDIQFFKQNNKFKMLFRSGGAVWQMEQLSDGGIDVRRMD